MERQGNTILITGGNSGIGLGLAQAFHAAGNRVVIAGRNAAALAQAAADFPGMGWLQADLGDAASVARLAEEAVRRYPALNVVVNNAGIMRPEDLKADVVSLAAIEDQVATNLLGPLRLTAALLPHLRRQGAATVFNVSSGLAFVPLGSVPTYCATKAGIHAYSQALRSQMRGTGVRVVEIAPPAVATNLMPLGEDAPPTMSTDAFVAAVMRILRETPQADEVMVDEVKPLRLAESAGNYAAVYGMLNG